jgi:hypothetical protein
MRKWYIFEENSQIWKSKNKLETHTVPNPNYEHAVKVTEKVRVTMAIWYKSVRLKAWRFN